MQWAHRDYGRVTDPIHKSHLNVLTGEYGCPKRFWFDRSQPPASTADIPSSSQSAALGTATHEVLARALTTGVSSNLRMEFETEFHRMGPIRRDDDWESELGDRIDMVRGVLAYGDKHIRTVIAVEPGFVTPFGEYWLSGHVDLIFEPARAPGTIALADWKTGTQKPHQLALDHGWEAGVYSAALRFGHFVQRGDLDKQTLEAALIDYAKAQVIEPTYGTFPSAIYHVHLADYVPYRRQGNKYITRAEDLHHYGMSEPGQRKYIPGEMRGGAWMPVRLTESDLPRLATRLRTVVGTVRMGRFIDRPGELCTRCTWREPCLNSGYVDPTEAKQLTELMRDH